jgi:hypothetical protein
MTCSRLWRRTWQSADQIGFYAGQQGCQFSIANLSRKKWPLLHRARTKIRAPAERHSQPAGIEKQEPNRDDEPGQNRPERSSNCVFARRCEGDLAAISDLRWSCPQRSPLQKPISTFGPTGNFCNTLFKPVLSVRFSERSLRRYERLVRAETIRELIEVPLNIFAWLPDRGRFRPSTMKKNEV